MDHCLVTTLAKTDSYYGNSHKLSPLKEQGGVVLVFSAPVPFFKRYKIYEGLREEATFQRTFDISLSFKNAKNDG